MRKKGEYCRVENLEHERRVWICTCVTIVSPIVQTIDTLVSVGQRLVPKIILPMLGMGVLLKKKIFIQQLIYTFIARRLNEKLPFSFFFSSPERRTLRRRWGF